MEIIHFKNEIAFEKWIAENYLSSAGIWMKFFKKHTKKENITYEKAVEIAICWGWIDSLIKRVDDDVYLRKFTPRSNCKNWSRVNKIRVIKLLKKGKMTKAGLQKIDSEILQEIRSKNISDKRKIEIPDFIRQHLKLHEPAWKNFTNLAVSYQNNYILWITQAKREETKEKRLNEAIKLLCENKKLGMR